MRRLYILAAAAMTVIAACGSSSRGTAAQPESPGTDNPATAAAPEAADPRTSDEPQADGDATRPARIVISKQSMTLSLYDADDALICRFPVAVGRNLGNKRRPGDMKTPEGDFNVQQIQPASTWTHDFGDGKGVIEGCYGNWFIRLKTPPHKGIGIHGTHDPASIGTRATEGCIRLRNDDLDSLKPLVRIGMAVRIDSSEADRAEDRRIDSISKPAAPAPARKPGGTSDVDDGNAAWHTVASGDTASAIAARYGTTLSRLRELNPSKSDFDRLSLGEHIRVR